MREAEVSGEHIIRRPITRISVVVAALNEGGNIQRLIDNLTLKGPPSGVEMVLVISDNGSDDEETFAEYDRIFSASPIPVVIVQGSKRGHLGAAREYGVKAAVDVFNNDHPNAGASHIIVSLDADSRIDHRYDFFGALVSRFEEDPDAVAAYGPLPFATAKNGTMDWTSPFIRPVFRLFLRRHFARNARSGMIKEFVHEPRELFHGGIEIFTQEAYDRMVERFGSAFDPEDSTAEDATFSLRMQHEFSGRRFMHDRSLVVPISLRAFEGDNGRVHVREGLKKAVSLAWSNEWISHRLAATLKKMSPEDRAEFIKGLGNLTYRSAVSVFIRQQEEQIFGLTAREYIFRYIDARDVQRRRQIKGYDVREGVSPVTHRTLYALVAHIPNGLELLPNEYVGFCVSKIHGIYLQRREWAEIVSFVDPITRKKVYAYIGKKPPVSEVNYTIASSLL